MLAVLGPRLGQHFHFHIRGVGGQAKSLAAVGLFLRSELCADAVHFLEIERPGIFAAGLGQSFIVHG